MRMEAIGGAHFLEMVHETRQVFEVAPERVHLTDWPVDRDGVLDHDAVRTAEVPLSLLGIVLRVRVDCCRNRAPAARTPGDQTQTQESERFVRALIPDDRQR